MMIEFHVIPSQVAPIVERELRKKLEKKALKMGRPSPFAADSTGMLPSGIRSRQLRN